MQVDAAVGNAGCGWLCDAAVGVGAGGGRHAYGLSVRAVRVENVSIALYRRYRPQTFAEVIGQEHVTEPLMQALSTGRVGHAYLFSGPRGCGKTTSARILARCLNCEEGPTATPCGECPSCVGLATGGAGTVDVIEIDAASHGGVDDARDLREKASYGPAQSRYKVYIIDEAHMVTPQGFNALLKIVEEPPEHVKFIFATTEPDKVIGTIRSRTHHYPFRLVPPSRLTEYLATLCEREGVAVEPGVLSFVVRAGGGSVRDSLSVLDQLISGSGEEGLTYAGAAALLGFTEGELLDATVEALAVGDGGAVFRQVDRVVETGHDPRRFIEDLLERYRDLIIMAASPDDAAAVLRGVPEDQLDRMRHQASSYGPGELSRCADIVNAGLTELTGATAPRLQLELICARLLLPAASGVGGYAARLDRLERRLDMAGPPSATTSAQGPGVPRGFGDMDATDAGVGPPVEDGVDGGGPSVRPSVREGRAGRSAPADGSATPARGDAPAPASGPGAQVPGPQVDAPAGGPAAEGALAAAGSAAAGSGAAGSGPAGGSGVAGSGAAGSGAAADSRGAQRAPTAPGSGGGRRAGRGPRTGAAPVMAPEPGEVQGSGAARPVGEAQREGVAQGAGVPQGAGLAQGAGVPQGTDGEGGAVAAAPGAGGPPRGGLDTDAIRRSWPDVLARIFTIRRVTWTFLSEHAQVLEYDGRRLVLGIATDGLTRTFHGGNHGEVVRQALIEALGVDVRIEGVSMTGGSAGGGPAGGGSGGGGRTARDRGPGRRAQRAAGPSDPGAPRAGGRGADAQPGRQGDAGQRGDTGQRGGRGSDEEAGHRGDAGQRSDRGPDAQSGGRGANVQRGGRGSDEEARRPGNRRDGGEGGAREGGADEGGAGQGRAGQGRAGQGGAGQGRAGEASGRGEGFAGRGEHGGSRAGQDGPPGPGDQGEGQRRGRSSTGRGRGGGSRGVRGPVDGYPGDIPPPTDDDIPPDDDMPPPPDHGARGGSPGGHSARGGSPDDHGARAGSPADAGARGRPPATGDAPRGATTREAGASRQAGAPESPSRGADADGWGKAGARAGGPPAGGAREEGEGGAGRSYGQFRGYSGLDTSGASPAGGPERDGRAGPDDRAGPGDEWAPPEGPREELAGFAMPPPRPSRAAGTGPYAEPEPSPEAPSGTGDDDEGADAPGNGPGARRADERGGARRDDEDITDLAAVGQPVIEKILGGVVIADDGNAPGR